MTAVSTGKVSSFLPDCVFVSALIGFDKLFTNGPHLSLPEYGPQLNFKGKW